MITGIDLVKEQINIARGEQISFSQEDLKINGHAVELRVYAKIRKIIFTRYRQIGNLSNSNGEGIRLMMVLTKVWIFQFIMTR